MDRTLSTLAAESIRTSAADASEWRSRIRIGDFAILALQLVLVLLLLRQFQIESPAFRILAMLACAGAATVLQRPQPCFDSADVGLGQRRLVIGIGFVLIATSHLPLSFRVRGAILLGLAALLITQRASLLPTPWWAAIWPILGAMFMFRLIANFYDLRHPHDHLYANRFSISRPADLMHVGSGHHSQAIG